MGWRIDDKTPFSVRASVTIAGEVELVASAAGSRWALTDLHVAWNDSTVTASTYFLLKEVGDGVSSNIITWHPSVSAGYLSFSLPNYGLIASDTNSALKFLASTVGCGTYTVLANGYHR